MNSPARPALTFISIPDWYPMKKQANPQGKSKKMFIPVLVAHVACCGGILLWPILGSTAITALGGVINSPVIQLGGLILLVAGFVFFLRRIKHKTRVTQQDVQSPAIYASNSDAAGIASLKER